MSTVPETIVLVHGLWMTPRSWEEWVPYYEAKGYKVLTPAYPGFEIEVEALRENPSVIAELTVPDVVGHLGETIGELEQQPIIIGHSFGGTLTQLLLDRGFGAAGSRSTLRRRRASTYSLSQLRRSSPRSPTRPSATTHSGSRRTSSTTRSRTR